MPIAIIGKSFRPRHEWQENIGRLENLEAAWQNADDCVGLRVKVDCFADDFLRASEAPLPKAVAQQGNGSSASAILFGKKSAADMRVNAQHRKKTSRDHANIEALGIARAGQGDSATAGRFHGFKGVALVSPIQIVLIRGADDGERALFRDEHELGWVAERERAKEHTVYDAEDGGIRSDAKRQRKNGNRGKSGTLRQQPKGITNVLKQFEHRSPRGTDTLPALTHARRVSFGVAEPPGRLPN